MPSRKAKKPNHLPDGRHIATVCTDELIVNGYLYCQRGNVPFSVVDAELTRRAAPKARQPRVGYVPFSGGSSGHRKVVQAEPPKKHDKPNRPTNVKDAKKDAKKNAEG